MLDLEDKTWKTMPKRPLSSAQRSTKPSTASRWKRRFSEEDNEEYFENPETEETVWELPENAVVEPLQKGWERRFSAEDGKHYYVNDDLDKSVWTVSEIEESLRAANV